MPKNNEYLNRLRRQLEDGPADGIELLNNLSNNPICDVRFDDSVPGISVVWKGYATSVQLRFIHESIIPMLRQHGVSRIFGDDTGLPTIHAEDQAWIVSDWMPRALEAGFRKGASKMAASYFGKLSVGNVQARAPAGLTLRAFDNAEDAKAWLRDGGTEPGHC